MMLQTYPLPLALMALLSFLISAIGLFLIARMLKRKNEIVGELAYAGATLIVAGELLQALWRLLRATTDRDYPWMNSSFLVLVTPGAVCLAWALWRGLRDDATDGEVVTAGAVWLLPLFLNGGLLALTAASRVILGGRAWFLILYTAATLAGIAAGLQLARRAIRHRLLLAALLFLIALIMSLALARITGFGLAAEWTGQISTLISQAAFAFAAFQLSREEQRSQ
jgi:hypothetical protein